MIVLIVLGFSNFFAVHFGIRKSAHFLTHLPRFLLYCTDCVGATSVRSEPWHTVGISKKLRSISIEKCFEVSYSGPLTD